MQVRRPAALLIAVSASLAVSAARAAPGCRAELAQEAEAEAGAAQVKIKVAGTPVALPLAHGGSRATIGVKSWQWRDGSILVSYTADQRSGPGGSEVLWEVSCAGAPGAKELVRIAGADFGHAALAQDGRTLYFSGKMGISALDLGTKKTRQLTKPPAQKRCDTNDTPRAIDVVVELQDGDKTLLFERGGPCGYEAGWESTLYSLQAPGSAKPVVRRPNRVASLVADAAGALWLSNGDCADPASYSAIWTSPDRGAHWKRVPVQMRIPQPVRQIISADEKAGQLAALTNPCGSAAHVDPAWVYVTSDGGVTWTPIAPPPGIPSHDGVPDSEQDPIRAAALVGPDAQRIQVWSDPAPGGQDGNDVVRWESADRGRSWKKLAGAPVPSRARDAVTIDGLTFRATLDGVMREASGARPVRIFPPSRDAAAGSEGARQ